jgi:two-component system chemotaxis response regulator CheB
MPDALRVLIVDDSAYMRVILKDMISSEPDFSVVGTAKNGLEAMELVEELDPDVVLMDIQMPRQDGIVTLQKIMKDHPTRVVMISAMDKADQHLPLKALALGAVDFISKPGGPLSIDIFKFRKGIIATIRNAAIAKMEALHHAREELPKATLSIPEDARAISGMRAVVIGASTGGPRTLEHIFSRLPRDIPAVIFIVQHIPPEFSDSFTRRLDSTGGPRTVLADDGVLAEPGTAYVAPGGFHLRMTECGHNHATLHLDTSPKVQFVRPSADVLFESASKCFGSNLLAIVLTGMGADGTNGARAVRAAGGRVVVQDEDSSVIFGMPRSAIASGAVDLVLPLEEIPEEIIRFLQGGSS